MKRVNLEITEEGIVFSIIETIHYEDLGASFDTVLGNSIVFDDIFVDLEIPQDHIIELGVVVLRIHVVHPIEFR